MSIKTYAYCRVSTVDQNEDRQIDAMIELNISKERIYVDKQSGKNFQRPAWQLLLNILMYGDVLYVESIDRLGRNYEDIQNQWRVLTKEKGVDIVVLDMPLLDTRQNKDLIGTFLADLILQLLSFVAQNERENIRRRQAEGIAAAKARGVHMGRPIKAIPENFGIIVKQWENEHISLAQALTQCGVSRSTFFQRLREHKRLESSEK